MIHRIYGDFAQRAIVLGQRYRKVDSMGMRSTIQIPSELIQ